jgi:hypothetical protein
MKSIISKVFQPPALTRQRVRIAYAVAVTVDMLQLLLGPLGWAFADEILDVAAMILIWRALGFHLLLLPTFALEFLPLGRYAADVDGLRGDCGGAAQEAAGRQSTAASSRAC